MQACAAGCELQIWSAGHKVSPWERQNSFSTHGTESPWKAGMAAEKRTYSLESSHAHQSFSTPAGGFMKSPHYPITRAAALTYLPFHFRWDVFHYLHQTAHYSLAPRVAVSQDTAQQYLAAGPPWPCDLALPTPLPWDPAAAHEGQTQQ